MKVTFKVIDTRNGKDITNDYCWVLRPDGRLCYNAYGDLIGMNHAQIVLNFEETIDKELDQSTSSTYICLDGARINTDVGYVSDWWNEYKKVILKGEL